MKNYIIVAAFAAPLTLLWSTSGYCQDSSESALGDPEPQSVQDPSPSNSRYFPPSLGTAGVAAIGPAVSSKASHSVGCSAANPCALPTPARDRVTVAQDKS
jgi:hypothetical protein